MLPGTINYCKVRRKAGITIRSSDLDRSLRAEYLQSILTNVHGLYRRMHNMFLFEMSHIYEDALEERKTAVTQSPYPLLYFSHPPMNRVDFI